MTNSFAGGEEVRPVAKRTRPASNETEGSASLLVSLGVISFCIGFYFLVIDPGAPINSTSLGVLSGVLPAEVVNFQKLAIGQSFTIAGAIFLAAAWRPR